MLHLQRHTFKQEIHLHNDHLILTHHMPFTWMTSNQYILYTNLKTPLILQSLDFYRTFTTANMDTAHYWPMAYKYSIWNAAIASLQFWTEDLDPVTLVRATKCVYTTFFYSSTSHTLCQQSDETLFGCFS